MQIIKSEKFAKWYQKLDLTQKTLIDVRLVRILVDNNFGHYKKLGSIFELKFKSGLRIYYGKVGNELVLLLTGGKKDTQAKDIAMAKEMFQEYLNDENSAETQSGRIYPY